MRPHFVKARVKVHVYPDGSALGIMSLGMRQSGARVLITESWYCPLRLQGRIAITSAFPPGSVGYEPEALCCDRGHVLVGFTSPQEAQYRCPGATVVWVNEHSHIYHFPGARDYGHTKLGAYMCEADAQAAGNRAAKNERHP